MLENIVISKFYKFLHKKNEIKIARNGFYYINNYVPARGLCELHRALDKGIIYLI